MRFSPFLLALALLVVLVAPATTATAPAPAPTAVGPDGATTTGAFGPATPATGTDTDALRSNASVSTVQVRNGSNQSRVLVVPEPAVQVTTIERATLDIGPATKFSGNVSAVAIENQAVAAYVDTEDDGVRQAHVSESLRDLERETDTLRERRQDAIEAYNRGAISTQTFLVELATIAATADALEARVNTLRMAAADIEGWTDSEKRRVRSRIESTRYQLRSLGGPVSDRAVAAIRGSEPTTRIFVTTGPQGYELTTIDNGTYIREAYRGAVRENDPSVPVEEAESELIDVFRQSYPVLTERWGEPSGEGSGTTFVLSTGMAGEGNVTAFVDSSSKRVFKEYQYHDLESFPAARTTSTVQSGLNLTINQSYPGGPIKVNVTDADTGDPVNATVTLSQNGAAGQSVGRTGDDGVLWTLSPRGSYTVYAVESETSLAVIQTNSTEAPAIN
jgi:hypothetical protein